MALDNVYFMTAPGFYEGGVRKLRLWLRRFKQDRQQILGYPRLGQARRSGFFHGVHKGKNQVEVLLLPSPVGSEPARDESPVGG